MAQGAQQPVRQGRRRDEVKARLGDAMLDLARDRPYATITVEEIASATGISRSSFYFYYADKGELLIDAAREAVQHLFLEAEGFWTSDGDPRDLVREALRLNARTFARHGTLMRVTLEVSTYDARLAEFWATSVARFAEAVGARIKADQEAGRTPAELDPASTAEALVTATQSYLFRKVCVAGAHADEAVEVMCEIWNRVLYPEQG